MLVVVAAEAGDDKKGEVVGEKHLVEGRPCEPVEGVG